MNDGDSLAGGGLPERVAEAVSGHPALSRLQLIGSRARGDPTMFSDWDFAVATDDFPLLANALPSLARALLPIAQQWDRLSDDKCYMLVLQGPTKIDLLFDVPNEQEPPWIVSAETLAAVDDHFWDWLLWLLSKEAGGNDRLVSSELAKMFDHLLEPMAVSACPTDINGALDAYMQARSAQECCHNVIVDRTLELEIRKALALRRSRYD
jgi:hypothetical protein